MSDRTSIIFAFTVIFAGFWQSYSRPAKMPDIKYYEYSRPEGPGSYSYKFELSDGTFREERGHILENGSLELLGSYIASNNKNKVSYSAVIDDYARKTNKRPDYPKSPPPQEPIEIPQEIDPAVLCSLLGRCAVNSQNGNVNPETSL